MHDLEESSLARLTIPDLLTPVQYYEGVRAGRPETQPMKRLMLAVLEDALRCLQTHTERRNAVHRRALAEIELWISDRKAQGPFAFETVCETLGIQPDHLRDGIRKWRVQLANGSNSRRIQRRSYMSRREPICSLVRRQSAPARDNLAAQSAAASQA